MKKEYGVITEQGDLGLGFDVIKEEHVKNIKEFKDLITKEEEGMEKINESE